MQKRIVISLIPFLLGIFSISITPAYSATKLPILEGISVPATSYPYVGMITIGDYTCTGTLVASNYVLSAAHCFFDENNQKITNLSNVTVTLNNQVFEVANVTTHPDYVSRADACIDGEIDASVIELKTAASGITPIALQRSAPTVGAQLLLVGFGVQGTGQSGEDDTFPGVGYVNYGHTTIETVDRTYVNWQFDSGQSEANTGGGDSGGPAFVDIDGVRYIDSITCGGTDNSGFGTSSSNTRADILASWVDSIAGGTGAGPTPGVPSSLVVDSVVVDLFDEDAYPLLIKGKVTLTKNFSPNKVGAKLTTAQARSSFKLDKNGSWRSRSGSDFFKLSGKLSGGKFTTTKVSYSAALGDTDAVYDNLVSLFPEEAANGDIVQFPIQLTIKNVAYSKTVNMKYNASTGVWKSVK